MKVIDKLPKLCLIAGLFLAAFACGTNDPNSPSTTATIAGTVNADASASGAAAHAFSDSSSNATITVSIVGTNLSTTTDSSGHFVLSGVAQGTATLRFQGPGMDATLEVSGLQAGQTLTISVHVSGSTAVRDEPSVQQQCAAVGANSEVEGQITSATAGSITVFQQGEPKGSYMCQVNGTTQIRNGNASLTLSQLQVGTRVHVKGTGMGSSAGVCQIKADQITVQ